MIFYVGSEIPQKKHHHKKITKDHRILWKNKTPNIPQENTSMWAQGISNKLNVTCIIYLFLVRFQIRLKHMAVLLILHVTSKKYIKSEV